MDAYFISHGGLGDNLYMIGALNFIKNFYKRLFFFCKYKYYDNVKLFFDKESNIICIPTNYKNNYKEPKKILNDKYNNSNVDIFICGECHKKVFASKITNAAFLNYKIINKKYTINCSTINDSNYNFIENFYKDAKLNLTYFYEYFNLPYTDESEKLYNSIRNYYIIFIQYRSSTGECLNIQNLVKRYINNDNTILICNDINLYSKDSIKYNLAQQFVMNKIIYYVDVIKNCDEIYLIDSCFIGIVLPYLKTNRLKTKNVNIILIRYTDDYMF